MGAGLLSFEAIPLFFFNLQNHATISGRMLVRIQVEVEKETRSAPFLGIAQSVDFVFFRSAIRKIFGRRRFLNDFEPGNQFFQKNGINVYTRALLQTSFSSRSDIAYAYIRVHAYIHVSHDTWHNIVQQYHYCCRSTIQEEIGNPRGQLSAAAG